MDPDTRTVGDLLDIVVNDEPPIFRLGFEPAELPPSRPPHRRASPLDRRSVAPFIEAVRAGAPDADVAKAAGVTTAQVRGWRLRLGVKRQRGTTAAKRIVGTLLRAPELGRALLEMGRHDDHDPPAAVRVAFDDEVLRRHLREHKADQVLERPSADFIRGRV